MGKIRASLCTDGCCVHVRYQATYEISLRDRDALTQQDISWIDIMEGVQGQVIDLFEWDLRSSENEHDYPRIFTRNARTEDETKTQLLELVKKFEAENPIKLKINKIE